MRFFMGVIMLLASTSLASALDPEVRKMMDGMDCSSYEIDKKNPNLKLPESYIAFWILTNEGPSDLNLVTAAGELIFVLEGKRGGKSQTFLGDAAYKYMLNLAKDGNKATVHICVTPASPYDDCMQESDPTISERACSTLIESRQYQGEGLAELHYFRGNARSATGRYSEAIEDLNRAITLLGTYAAAYNNRAMAYLNLGEADRAIADLNEALRIDPTLAISHINRGRILADRGDFAGAVQDFSEAIAIAPDGGDAYFFRALANCMLAKDSGVFEDISRAVDLRSLDPANLQQFLTSHGFYDRKPTGKFDRKTQKATKKWIGAGCPGPAK